MSSAADIQQALDGFRRGLASGRVAHAYEIVGPPRGAARALAESILEILFCTSESKPCGTCTACRHIRLHEHVDVWWIEPESKSRWITIDRLREELLPKIGQTSFEGGWKAAVIVGADRMNEAAANAFLKTLEEPPPRTLFLLLTDAPQEILPTIRSRCQRMIVGGGGATAALAPEWRDAALDLLADATSATVAGRMASAARLSALFEEIKQRITDDVEATMDPAELGAAAGSEGRSVEKDVLAARIGARLAETRKDVLGVIQDWQRDLLLLVLRADEAGVRLKDRLPSLRRQAEQLDYLTAMARLKKTDDLVRLFDRNLSSDSVCWSFFRDLPMQARKTL